MWNSPPKSCSCRNNYGDKANFESYFLIQNGRLPDPCANGSNFSEPDYPRRVQNIAARKAKRLYWLICIYINTTSAIARY